MVHHYRKKKSEGKTLAIAYAVWLAGGLCGAHRYYLGKMKSGHVMMVLSVIVTIIWLLIARNIVVDTMAIINLGGELPQGGLISFFSLCALLLIGELSFSDLVIAPNTSLLMSIGLPCLLVLLGWWLLDALLLKTMLKSSR